MQSLFCEPNELKELTLDWGRGTGSALPPILVRCPLVLIEDLLLEGSNFLGVCAFILARSVGVRRAVVRGFRS